MATKQVKQPNIEHIINALEPFDAAVKHLGTPARFALQAIIDALDQAMQMGLLLVEGKDPQSQEVQTSFLLVVGKLTQFRSMLALPVGGPAVRFIEILQGKWDD